MKLQFKHQAYQTKAVESVVNVFAGQPNSKNIKYRIDPGATQQKNGRYIDESGHFMEDDVFDGFKNDNIYISDEQLLKNINEVQRIQNLPLSISIDDFKTIKKNEFKADATYTKRAKKISKLHLDVEMETGTGKTYCYIKSIFELNERYGWNKFIVVVPSIAIREGVKKSLEITADHFQQDYGKKVKFFTYNSKELHNIETFSSDSGVNVMIINIQAFNATGKDNRRIYEELDDFQSRRPIDVIKKNRPILILDEPQKMGGDKTLDSLVHFNPLFILRYSATHRVQHNKIHRLDALDAYNQKLVKKIAVRGITTKGLSGTNAYLYLDNIVISKSDPIAKLEIEVKQSSGIKRILKNVSKGRKLEDLSNGLKEYKGFTVANIDAVNDTLEFTNGVIIKAGEVNGDVNEESLRRIQIRETINAHLLKEQMLFSKGIKVLSLFFIDEVAKYRDYKQEDEKGEYARVFEEEYKYAIDQLKQEIAFDTKYRKYIDGITAEDTHKGYFSIDKKGKMVNSLKSTKAEKVESTDVSAYDLILKKKEQLLSFEEDTRFIFSHSALREGWDNPNVFVICTLKHSDNTISKRQEVGRGLRIAVDQHGERQDNPQTVHETNVLTVVASESYSDFVTALQKDIGESLSERPRIANIEYFEDKILLVDGEKVVVTPLMAKQIYRYLVKNDYTDDNDNITPAYINDAKELILSALPEELKPYSSQIFSLIDSVYTQEKLPGIANDRTDKTNNLNDNFNRKEFKELWNRINRKAVYTVHFESTELIEKCINALNKELHVTPLSYSVKTGIQHAALTDEQIKTGASFKILKTREEFENTTASSSVRYDLLGEISEQTNLMRKTVAAILTGILKGIFDKFKINPESFITNASRLIQEQKATTIIEWLSYDTLEERHEMDIFTEAQTKQDFKNAIKKNKHIYDYVVTDSKVEKVFAEELDTSDDVVVYAKLPKGFTIPTPVGNYNPDWAISFKEGTIKHVYFVAETKGSMSSMELREIEKVRIECARKFFDKLALANGDVKYDVVNSYDKLMEVVR
ncbi:type III restriction-modification system endonuclease [Ancylomarina longa]|uniref:Restriction endonuclease subunit R n=1 Tax=Ancylomarina longa TaxID=2487017 RepID=A0A434AVE3_9BACT|nr:DEAD/DEAH box helicase family protein [Ancylomarina longa]RUT78428.1 restriction endonuclease subunit R [Ancylomarina longa]